MASCQLKVHVVIVKYEYIAGGGGVGQKLVVPSAENTRLAETSNTVCKIWAGKTTLMHSCIMNEHLPVRLSRLCSNTKNVYFLSVFPPDMSRSRYMYVIEVSPHLAEHLRYIMEKGNPVYLSDCSVAWEGGGGGFDQGVDRSCNLKRGHCSSEQKQLKENERRPLRLKNRKLSTCRLESTTLHPA